MGLQLAVRATARLVLGTVFGVNHDAEASPGSEMINERPESSERIGEVVEHPDGADVMELPYLMLVHLKQRALHEAHHGQERPAGLGAGGGL